MKTPIEVCREIAIDMEADAHNFDGKPFNGRAVNETRRILRRLRKRYAIARGPACLYLLHFDRPFGHARHYLGYTGKASALDDRINAHRSGQGSALVRAVLAAGIDFRVVLTCRVPLSRARSLERRLKNNGSSARICPICAVETRAARTSCKARWRQARKQNKQETL